MATLRSAFVQTCYSGSPCLSFLSSLSALLASSYDDPNTQDHVCRIPRLPTSVSAGFRRIQHTLLIDKARSNWIQSYYGPSLFRITDNHSSDFFSTEPDDGTFVHVLELLGPEIRQTSDLDTVCSQQVSAFEVDPTSAASSHKDSDENYSEVVDI